MNRLESALQFIKMGIAVIPLRHRGKEPASELMGGTWEAYKETLPTEYQAQIWLQSGWCNYGVVAGWGNLAMIDFDNADTLAMWLDYFAMLNKHVQVIPMPYMVQTARGAHVYVRLWGQELANQKRRGVDVKIHGYVVGPASVHPSGAVYTAMGEMQFPDVWDLETVLPVDLFPHVAPEASVGQIDGLQMPFEQFTTTEYDPFAAASGSTGSVDLLDAVKGRVRIESLFPDARKTSVDGRWLGCKCPFHNDSKPSAWIDVRRQLFGCQVCGFKPMDAINLYARMHSMSESAAVSAMAREVGVWG